MIQRFAQAVIPNGASQSKDFQPPTGNPQTAPGQIFPDSNSIQQPSGAQLLQTQNAQISVPTGSAAEAKQVTVARSGSWEILIALAAALVIIFLARFWLERRKLGEADLPVTEPQPLAVEPQPVRMKKTVNTKRSTVKPTAKKSKTKSKSKRKNRNRR